MSEAILYVVSVLERQEDGRLAWRGLLTTRDHEEANALYASLVADEGVKARVQAILPRKKR